MKVVKLGGSAGQGVFTTGRALLHIFSSLGYYVFGYPEYPSLVRGGHNSYEIVVSRENVYAPHQLTDVLIALNNKAFEFHKDALKQGALVLADSALQLDYDNVIHIPIAEVLKESGASQKMTNTALVAATLSALSLPLQPLLDFVKTTFASKGEEVVRQNERVAQLAYERVDRRVPFISPPDNTPKRVATGNELIARGAVAGGLTFYAAYPMTPSTGVLHSLIKHQEQWGAVVLQGEDEIACANMAVGASFAGARAMVGTSGGGFALMTETVSMVGMSETPVVFFIAQRVGPSTGMPTWTEQGDLFQVLGAGQGEFPRIIVAPGTGEEAVYWAAEALNLAEEFQVPVFLLSDKFLSESDHTYGNVFDKIEIRRGKLVLDAPALPPHQRFPRYAYTEDGISPRTIPGVKGGEHVATSYTHREDSFTSEDFDERVKTVKKRLNKLNTIRQRAPRYNVYGDESGEWALITWGSGLGPALELRKEMDVNVVHFSYLYPLNPAHLQQLKDSFEHLVVVENNATGLFQQLLRLEGLDTSLFIRKANGRPFFPFQLKDAFERVKATHSSVFIDKERYENKEFYAAWRY
jgi:2-oxoglutarate ferredoxin oxidoreductase subunit alpha